MRPEAVRIPGPTGIAGTLRTLQSEPVSGAHVYAYRSARTGLRGPADFEALSDEAGHYFLDLVEGDYHLVARQRQDGTDSGPPRSGDAWAIYPRNPVTVVGGFSSRADILLQPLAAGRVLRAGSLSSGETGFRGRIVDGRSIPVAGAFALGYRDEHRNRPPDFNAPVTGEDGLFHLYLSQGGDYCIAARMKTRGQPRFDEPYGIPDGGENGCFSIETGQILDLGTLILRPFGSR